MESEFAVEQYLDGVAERARDQIDPNSLMVLSRAVEYFDLAATYGSLVSAFASVQADVLLVSYTSDWRYPAAEMEEMQKVLGARSRHVVIDSPMGHGAFRYEPGTCEAEVRQFLARETAAVR